MRKKGGFTLIELMIAIVIIGVLVAMAIPNYQGSIERAKCSQAIQVLKDMRSAALSFYANNEVFPGVNDETDLEVEVGANFYSDDSNPDWDFEITTGGGDVLVLEAQRRRGPHFTNGNTIISVTDDPANNIFEVWGGSYPRDDPTNW